MFASPSFFALIVHPSTWLNISWAISFGVLLAYLHVHNNNTCSQRLVS